MYMFASIAIIDGKPATGAQLCSLCLSKRNVVTDRSSVPEPVFQLTSLIQHSVDGMFVSFPVGPSSQNIFPKRKTVRNNVVASQLLRNSDTEQAH